LLDFDLLIYFHTRKFLSLSARPCDFNVRFRGSAHPEVEPRVIRRKKAAAGFQKKESCRRLSLPPFGNTAVYACRLQLRETSVRRILVSQLCPMLIRPPRNGTSGQFDPHTDPIVRVSRDSIRERLQAYFWTEGKDERRTARTAARPSMIRAP